MKLAETVMHHVSEQLAGVEEGLRAELSQASPAVKPVLMHLMESGGKRVRPIMTILSAGLFAEDTRAAIPVAVAAELIHMATLVHDDVIDVAATRRGRPTVNTLWDNQTAVLAGDALLARALVMLVDTGMGPVVKIMADMIKQTCEGEIVQNANLGNIEQDESDYLARIEKKTALFFAACCQCGALIGGCSPADAAAMREYGRLVGLAFQIVDDLLDVSAEAAVVGKPVGNDLASGVITLPVIHAMHFADNGAEIRQRISSGPLSGGEVSDILSLVRANGALEYTQRMAEQMVQEACQVLPKGMQETTRNLLVGIAEAMLTRAF